MFLLNYLIIKSEEIKGLPAIKTLNAIEKIYLNQHLLKKRVFRLERNIKIIIAVGMLSALILGFFEILFPFYLSYRGISLADMGLIFSISTLVIAFFRVFLGEYTDIYGRKKVYLASSALSATTKSIFPFSLGKIELAFNKFWDDLQDNLRISVHNVMFYENSRKSFTKLFSWFTAGSFVLQAVGNLSLALFLVISGYSGCFFILVGIEIIKFILLLFYKEEKKQGLNKKMSFKEAYSFKLGRDLKILALSAAVGNFGFGIAHGFLLPLYFAGKYGLDIAQISLVTAIHRLVFLTSPLAGKIMNRIGAKGTYIMATSVYVISFLAIGFITFPIFIFVPIFLLHDILGGGIRMTATNFMVHTLVDERRRGREANTFDVIQIFAAIASPSIAGALAMINWDYLFITGGLIFLISLIIFCLFFKTKI